MVLICVRRTTRSRFFSLRRVHLGKECGRICTTLERCPARKQLLTLAGSHSRPLRALHPGGSGGSLMGGISLEDDVIGQCGISDLKNCGGCCTHAGCGKVAKQEKKKRRLAVTELRGDAVQPASLANIVPTLKMGECWLL
uniref:Uncharacterized protein n=1 Tax=Sphaerodactylus townsendi TaxID=933632 RepID=A0ACB8G9E9_9SAUR